LTKFLIQYRKVIVFTIALLVVLWCLYSLRAVLLPFFLGLILAYLLLPPVRWIENHLPRKGKRMRAKRVSIIITMYLLVLGILFLIGYFTVPAVVNSAASLLNSLPQIIPDIIHRIQGLTDDLQSRIPAEIRQQVDDYILRLLAAIGDTTQSAFLTGISYIPGTIGLILGFVSLPIFLFYLLKDAESLSESFYSSFPAGMVRHVRRIVGIVEEILGRYLKGQLLLGVIIGCIDFTWLLILGIPYAPALAFLAGVMELMPVLGPWITGIVGVIVTLATVPDKTFWVIAIYVIVQIIEGNVLSPRIQGSAMRIHPVVVLVLIILGAYFAGFWGVILVVPVTATLIPVYKYAVKSLRDDAGGHPPEDQPHSQPR
jgi:predicted PurR-regulated permease PerM